MADFPGKNHIFICPVPGKNSWPELVGENVEKAVSVIEAENPLVHVVVLKEGTPATSDFGCSRVRIWVDKNGVVLNVPRIG